jgi:hypothetical protein
VRLARADIDPDALIALGWFTDRVAGVAHRTVTQYQGRADFPEPRQVVRRGKGSQGLYPGRRPGRLLAGGTGQARAAAQALILT